MNTVVELRELEVCHCGGKGPLAAFAIFRRKRGALTNVRLGAKALEERIVTVSEVGRGDVPTLTVKSSADYPVLFLIGDRLNGGGQDRVVVSSTIVEAGATAQISVKCVERQRWQPTEHKAFHAGDTICSSDVRSILARSREVDPQVTQSTVWAKVGDTIADLQVNAPTSSLSDAYTSQRDQLRELMQEVTVPCSADGIAVAIGDRIVSVDLFGSRGLCAESWRRIVRGCAIDALRGERTDCSVTVERVRQLLAGAGNARWEQSPKTGDTVEAHASFDTYRASSLSRVEGLVHSSIVCG